MLRMLEANNQPRTFQAKGASSGRGKENASSSNYSGASSRTGAGVNTSGLSRQQMSALAGALGVATGNPEIGSMANIGMNMAANNPMGAALGIAGMFGAKAPALSLANAAINGLNPQSTMSLAAAAGLVSPMAAAALSLADSLSNGALSRGAMDGYNRGVAGLASESNDPVGSLAGMKGAHGLEGRLQGLADSLRGYFSRKSESESDGTGGSSSGGSGGGGGNSSQGSTGGGSHSDSGGRGGPGGAGY